MTRTGAIAAKPYIPLSRLREIHEMARSNYHNWGGDSVSVTFRNYVDDELARLEIEQLRARVAELQAQVNAIPAEAMAYVVGMYMLSSSGAPLGERKDYFDNMLQVQEWLHLTGYYERVLEAREKAATS